MNAKQITYTKVVPWILNIGGLIAFFWGSNQVQSCYRLLYSFSGADGGAANPVGLESVPSNVTGYLYLSYLGLFVILLAQWLKRFAERELRKS